MTAKTGEKCPVSGVWKVVGDLLLSYLMLFSFNESDGKSRRSV